MSLALALSTYMYLTFPNDMEAWNSEQKPPTPPSPVHLRTRILLEKKILHQCLLMLLVKHRMTKKDTHHEMARLCLLGSRWSHSCKEEDDSIMEVKPLRAYLQQKATCMRQSYMTRGHIHITGETAEQK